MRPRRKQQPHHEVSYGRGSESALYEVVSPAVYVIRVFGLAPYGYSHNSRSSDYRLQPSCCNCLFTLLWASLYSYVVYTALIRFDGTNKDKPVLGVTEKGKLILNYLVAIVDLALNVAWRKRFCQIWNSIQDFDSGFVHSGSPAQLSRYSPMLRHAKSWVWACMGTGVLGWTSINQLGMHAFAEPYLQNIGYMLTYVGTCVAVFKYCGLVFLLGQRFAYLNELVREQQSCSRTHLQILRASLEVKKLETTYDQLLSTSEKLNDIYSWSLFLFLLNLFCHAVSNMYFFTIWTIVDPAYLSNPLVVFCEFSWLVIYLVQMLLLHVACHFTSMQANRTANVLLDWRRHADRQSKQNEFTSTLHYLNRRLQFTAAGCFDVNLPLLTTTFGHLTTYLVILLQIPSGSGDT